MKLNSRVYDMFVLGSFGFLSLFFFLKSTQSAIGALADHLVISEIQIAGATATDEFVELYNPTTAPIDLTSYRLIRLTSGGSSANLVASMSGTIASKSYYLIKHPDSVVSADLDYSAASNSIALNSTVILLAPDLVTEIDKVGFGTAGDFETATVANPPTNGSLERKAFASSTLASMTSGADVLAGNGEDTDNNSADFVVREVADPQNTNSSPEPLAGPSPSVSPSPTIEPSPSVIPSPSLEPSPIPSPDPSPSPVVEPSPSPTLIPSLEPSPSIEPSPTLTPRPHPVFDRIMVCGWTIKTINTRFFSMNLPVFGCRWVSGG